MRRGARSRGLALVAALGATLVVVPSAAAAAPNYILVSGPGLAHPVLLGDWGENGTLLSALVGAPSAHGSLIRGLAGRPRLDLAEFWGWSGKPPTRARDANQHGWFYPAHKRSPPIIEIVLGGRRVPRLVPVRVLRILARHHIPTRL